MTIYTDMTPAARFTELDRLATLFFHTERWKSAFARRYGRSYQMVAAWQNNGAPIWALQAMADALRAKQLSKAVQIIQES